MKRLKDIASERLFILLVAYLLVLNLPYFLNLVIYLHDSLFPFIIFHVMYADFFFNGEFMQWLPYSVYGLQNDFPQMLLSISNYSAGAVAGLLRIRDTLLVYKVSMLIEQLIFLSGMYLLSRDLFRSRAAVAFACISAAGSIVLTWQVTFDFRAFYFLPLMVYFIRRFFTKYKFLYLALSMNLLMLSMPGNTPYCFEIIFLQLSIVFLVLLLHHHGDWRRRFSLTGTDIAATAALTVTCLILAYSFFYISMHLKDSLQIFSEGRNLETMKTPIGRFLTFGGFIGFEKFSGLFKPDLYDFKGGEPYFGDDLTLYIGLLPLPLILYGTFKAARDPMLRAFVLVVVVMGLFSLGGVFSKALYYTVPGMSYYRHIGLSVGSFKVFLPLIAGFGLDRLLDDDRVKNYFALSVATSMILLTGAVIYYAVPSEGTLKTIALLYAVLVAATVSAFLLLYGRFRSKRFFIVFLLAGAGLEMLGYQAILSARNYAIAGKIGAGFAALEKLDYKPERTASLKGVSNMANFNFLRDVGEVDRALYSFYYNFLRHEPCATELRTDFMNSHVAKLMTARGADIRLFDLRLPPDQNFLAAIGCKSPKLKLVTNVVFAADENEAVDAVRSIIEIDRVIVLNGVPEDLRKAWINRPESGGSVRVVDFYGNGIEAVADVPDKDGAWLYYADGYHPAWKAYVNGSRVHIAQANVGFKAVRLQQGENRVKFVYGDSKIALMYCLITGGMVFMVYFFWIFFGLCAGLKRD